MSVTNKVLNKLYVNKLTVYKHSHTGSYIPYEIISNILKFSSDERSEVLTAHRSLPERKVECFSHMISRGKMNFPHLLRNIKDETNVEDKKGIETFILKILRKVINISNNRLYFLCHWASEKGYPRIVRMLLKKDTFNTNVHQATLRAIMAGHYDVTRLILNDRRIILNKKNEFNNINFLLISLGEALQRKQHEIANFLVSASIVKKFNMHLSSKYSLGIPIVKRIQVAISSGNEKSVQYLLALLSNTKPYREHKKNESLKRLINELYQNSIRISIQTGHLDVLKILISKSEFLKEEGRHSPLMTAVKFNQIKIVRFLLDENRVDPSEQDNAALIFACQKGYYEIFKALKNCGKINTRKALSLAFVKCISSLKDQITYYKNNNLVGYTKIIKDLINHNYIKFTDQIIVVISKIFRFSVNKNVNNISLLLLNSKVRPLPTHLLLKLLGKDLEQKKQITTLVCKRLRILVNTKPKKTGSIEHLNRLVKKYNKIDSFYNQVPAITKKLIIENVMETTTLAVNKHKNEIVDLMCQVLVCYERYQGKELIELERVNNINIRKNKTISINIFRNFLNALKVNNRYDLLGFFAKHMPSLKFPIIVFLEQLNASVENCRTDEEALILERIYKFINSKYIDLFRYFDEDNPIDNHLSQNTNFKLDAWKLVDLLVDNASTKQRFNVLIFLANFTLKTKLNLTYDSFENGEDLFTYSYMKERSFVHFYRVQNTIKWWMHKLFIDKNLPYSLLEKLFTSISEKMFITHWNQIKQDLEKGVFSSFIDSNRVICFACISGYYEKAQSLIKIKHSWSSREIFDVISSLCTRIKTSDTSQEEISYIFNIIKFFLENLRDRISVSHLNWIIAIVFDRNKLVSLQKYITQKMFDYDDFSFIIVAERCIKNNDIDHLRYLFSDPARCDSFILYRLINCLNTYRYQKKLPDVEKESMLKVLLSDSRFDQKKYLPGVLLNVCDTIRNFDYIAKLFNIDPLVSLEWAIGNKTIKKLKKILKNNSDISQEVVLDLSIRYDWFELMKKTIEKNNIQVTNNMFIQYAKTGFKKRISRIINKIVDYFLSHEIINVSYNNNQLLKIAIQTGCKVLFHRLITHNEFILFENNLIEFESLIFENWGQNYRFKKYFLQTLKKYEEKLRKHTLSSTQYIPEAKRRKLNSDC